MQALLLIEYIQSFFVAADGRVVIMLSDIRGYASGLVHFFLAMFVSPHVRNKWPTRFPLIFRVIQHWNKNIPLEIRDLF